MIDIVTSLIVSKNLEFEEGEIKLLGANICLIPPEVYLFLFKELQNNKNEKIFYNSSSESAFAWVKNLIKVSKKNSPEEIIEFLPKILNLLAYGRVTVVKSDFKNSYFEFKLSNSLFPELYGDSKQAVDLGFAGFLAGACKAMCSKNMICIEKECVSQGASDCFFIVKEEK